MPTDIEQTIYKLGIDDSDYIKGVDSLSASTKKLSEAQEAANKKLNQLKETSRLTKEELKKYNVELKENEKQITAASAKLSLLNSLSSKNKEAVALATAELAKYSNIQKDIQSKIAATNISLNNNNAAITAQKKVLNEAEKASAGFVGGLKKVYSGLGSIANIIPGLGIAGLVGLISGPLINAFTEWYDSLSKTNGALKLLKLNQDNLNEVVAAANKDAGKQTADLKILYQAATDVNLSMKDRLAAVRALQTEFPDYFKNISAETILNGNAKKAYDELAASIIATARATAAKAKIDELESKQLDKDFERRKVIDEAFEQSKKAQVSTIKFAEFQGTAEEFALSRTVEGQKKIIQAKKLFRLTQIDEDKKSLQAQEDFLVQFAGLPTIAKVIEEKVKKGGKKETDKKIRDINDDFESRKAAILEAQAKLAAAEFEGDVAIRKQYAEKLKRAIIDINNDKSLKPGERTELIKLTTTLNTSELDKALADFHKKQTDARTKLNDELNTLQEKNTQDQLNLIQDEFDRRAKLIDFNEQKELDTAKENTSKRLAALDLQRLLIGEQAYQDAKNNIISAGELQTLNITQKFANQRKDLSADIFKSLLDAYSGAIRNADLIRNEDEAKALKSAQDRFLKHEITFKQFQKEITDIQKKYNKERLDNDLQTEINQLAELDRRIAATIDKTTKEYADLIELQKKYREKIAGDKKKQVTDTESTGGSTDVLGGTITPEAAAAIARINFLQEKIQSVANSVISFWQVANEVEQKALDRSISIQEKRVDAAQRIAARGNAQYLKAEEDRLKELNIKRENAARKQLGIDAALQASQILVGITGAIAKIATPGAGPALIISEIALIIGALATGYGLVKSLQGNQPKLFVGTKDTGGGGREDSQGGFTATLHPNEAVIPADRNKAYHPAVAAIYDRTIPAEHLNNFVKTYHKIKGVPQPNYQRIKDAAELKINSDGSMAVLLSENNKKLDEHIDLQKQTLRAMKSMSVSANVDKNGVAIMVNEYISQMKIDKRV